MPPHKCALDANQFSVGLSEHLLFGMPCATPTRNYTSRLDEVDKVDQRVRDTELDMRDSSTLRPFAHIYTGWRLDYYCEQIKNQIGLTLPPACSPPLRSLHSNPQSTDLLGQAGDIAFGPE